MKFFLDTANVNEIKEAKSWGVLDGVTTNPTLMAAASEELHMDFEEMATTICKLVDGPVSLETTTLKADEIVAEAKDLMRFGKNVVTKVAIGQGGTEGIKAIRRLSEMGIKVNVTLVFSANQALLAAKAGATYVSPFIGRLDDVGHRGMDVIEQTLEIFRQYGFKTLTLVSSVRHPIHVLQAAKLGAPVTTMPFKVLAQLFAHPLTVVGMERFLKDWEKVKARRKAELIQR